MEHNNQFIVKGRPLSSVDVAKANDAFEHFIGAATLKSILGHYRNICDLLHLRPNIISLFYPKLKVSLSSWKAKALWKKFDARASHKCYARGKACSTTRVLIIGAGPCGLRTAIEAQLLGAKVVVVEKRDRMSRNNVLHLWPFVIEDLRALGAKKFLGKFCAGSIDHISIRQLQCILLKVCLLLGVEIYTEVSFEKLIEPNLDEKIGWRAEFKPYDHPVSQYEFDVIIGADGKRNTLQGFKRKEFRGKLAIAITANFINKHTEADARVEEISGVAFIFNQKFFKELNMETGIDLENIVYYKDETHYFVMTAKKHSLLEKGVIKQDFSDTARLLSHENVDREALLNYAREAADFSTNYQMPDLEFAVNHYGQPDVAMFDFTSMYAAENASKVIERCGYKLLMVLVGDSLLEPFWPTGSGCARGFLSSLDACWAIKGWGSGLLTPLEILAERESIYRLLAQTTPENLNKDYKSYTLDPSTRYPNLNKSTLSPPQVLNLYNTDDPSGVELTKVSNSFSTTLESQKKRRKKDTYIDAITLINWIKEQVKDYKDIVVEDITSSLKDGRVLCAIINHYRPDLLDYNLIQAENVIQNNQLAFDLLEKELGVLPVMTGEDINNSEVPDYLTMFSYLTKVYETFRGEIPHIKHLNLDLSEPKEQIEEPLFVKTWASRSSSAIVNNPTKYHSENNSLNKSLLTSERKAKKRKSFEKNEISMEGRKKRLEEIVNNRLERQNKRREQRRMQTERFIKSMQMLQSNAKLDSSEPFEDYSLFVYRQTAPQFKDRVKELEKKFKYTPDHENYLLTQSKENAAVDKEFAARIRNLEDKWRGPHSPEKRPKGLMRAIGKIDSTDWNIKEIEKKIKENKLGKSRNKEKERVPKWNREQFLARQTKMEKKHLNRQNSSEAKFCELDRNLKHLEQRLKEGSVRDLGKNKVAAITEKFVTKLENTEQPIQKSASKSTFKSNANNSEYCHFCQKRVYLMERLSAEGRFFHSSCFKCQYCYTNLRLGNYLFDREGQFGYRFYCSQHFGMVDLSKDLSNDKIKYQVPTPLSKVDLLERVETPERIELENLSSEYDESLSQIDEDEWTDRNFGASTTEICSSNEEDYSSSFSDSETDDEDAFEEALEEPPTKEGTLRLMERYKLRYSKDSQKGKIDYDDSSSDSDHSSYHENTSEDDEDDPVTEGEEEIRARELRKQEVAVEPPVVQTDTGSDTEVISEETSSNSSNKHNSATEISTDSEFAVDDPTPTRDVPAIIFNDFHVTKTRGSCGKLKILQVKSHVLQVPITSKSHNQNVNLNPVTTAPLKVLPILSKVTQNNPIDGYCLNRTQSTSGIATRVSLELKKKYLLGDNGLGGAIQKSGSVSAIDSKFKSFHSNITDCQKLLKTKIETLEPNLDKTNFKNSDFKSPLSTIPKPELISNQRLETREINNPTTNILKENVTLLSEQHKFEDDESVPESNTVVECFNYDLEGRPRSPLQEIPILVPTINWTQVNKNRDNCISSDSLISDSDQSAGNNKSYQRTKKIINTIPRVEICDDNGEVLHDWDNNFAFDSLNIPPPTLSHLTGHSSALNDTSKSVTCSKIILNQPKILPHLHKEYTHVEHSNKDKVGRNPTSEQSTPSDQESVADHTTTVLTETELSDWARDGSVSDDFEDIEFGLNLGLKNELKSVSLQKEASKAKMEDFEEAKHVCGKEKYQKNVENFQNILSNLEFMDTEEESSDEEELKDNFIKNSGYVVFHNEDEIAKDSLDPGIDNITQTVNPLVLATIDFDDLSSQDNNTGYCIIGDDDQISNLKKVIQPICDNEENSLLVVDTGTTTEENTCSDLTVKNVNSEQELIKNSKADMYLQLGTSNETEQKKDQINQDYLNFCQRLQSKIEFGNVKDSISIKKLKCKDKYAQVDTVKNEEKNIVESNILTENNQPIQNISYKKEIIQKSRSENQKLIQEMVMNKMKAQNKVLERKRRNRNLNSLDKSSDLIKPNILDIENQENITKQVSNQMSPLKSCPIEIKNIQKSLGEVQPLSKHFSKNVGVERNSWSNIQTVVKIDPEAPNFQIKSHNKELYKTNDKLKTKIPTNVNDELVVNINDHLPQKEKLIRRIKKDNCSEEIKDNLKLFFTNSDRQNRCVHMNEQSKKKRPHSYTSKSEEIHPGRTKSVSDISKNSIHKSSNLNIKEEIKNISHLCKSDSNLMVNNSDNFKKPNVERRKSISKLISEFFGRKKDNKIVTSNESPSKKFITKMTSKSKDNTKEQILRTRSLSSIASTTQKYISTSPPPIPPLPLNYAKTRTSNFIGASSDEESEWKPCQLHSDDLDRPDVSTEGRRSIKNSRRLSRQAQLKRHRTAQEIQRQLEETEVKIKELEQKGVLVEKALRGEANDELNGREESELFQQWFNIMRELTDLRRFEKELTVRAQELQLEDRHARLQQDLRERLENDGVKSKKDVMLESTIIGEMMEIVKKRDSLIAVLEQDRIRYSKEDQDFEEEMLQRRLLPSQFSKNNNY